jgi:hypothetical protein
MELDVKLHRAVYLRGEQSDEKHLFVPPKTHQSCSLRHLHPELRRGTLHCVEVSDG